MNCPFYGSGKVKFLRRYSQRVNLSTFKEKKANFTTYSIALLLKCSLRLTVRIIKWFTELFRREDRVK